MEGIELGLQVHGQLNWRGRNGEDKRDYSPWVRLLNILCVIK